MSELLEIARHLRGIKLKTNSYLCHCPAHQDEKPSLTLTESDGKILFHCKAGCSQDSVYQALKPFLEVKKEEPRLVKRWIYKDEKGEEHLRVSRFETSTGKTFKQEHLSGTTWISGGAERIICPLYYDEWKDEEHVFFVEGEKCADALRDKLQPATCIPGGANGWKEYYATFFKGKRVTILPDNDKPGREFSKRVYDSIRAAGGKPKIQQLSGLAEKEDVVEWLERGGDPSTLQESDEGSSLFGEIDQLIHFNQEHSIGFGVPLFEDALGKISPTDLILLTGSSGEGKTQLASHIAKQVCLEGKRVTFFALEAFNREIESRILYGMLADRFFQDPNHPLVYIMYRAWIQGDPKVVEALKPYKKEVEGEFKRIYGDRLRMIYRDSSTFTIKEFERYFETYARESDLIIVDHLNYFDSHDDKKSENKMMEEVMKRIRDCVLIAKKPVLLLTHVRKKDSREHKILPDMEDIHGSSNIFKIATKSIVIGIDYSNEDREYSRTLVRIPKDRYGEGIGRYVFRMLFNVKTRSYERSYDVGRVAREKNQEIFELLEPHKLPRWVRGERKELEDTL